MDAAARATEGGISMSDILIKDMEMPEDGHWGTVSIPFYIHGDGSVSDSKGHIIGSAVHIPPHGRTIDADALKVSLAFAEKTAEWAVPALRAVLMVIDEMPTIIPAEESINIQKEFMQNWHEEDSE